MVKQHHTNKLNYFLVSTVTRGTVSTEEPNVISRKETLEYDSGVSGTTDIVYKHSYLMFVHLQY